jgi:long-chain acyl-CoA synthetase
MNLVRAFLASAEKNLPKTAVYWGDAAFTYQHFCEQAAWVANVLRDKFQVQPGDRVGIWVKNCPEFISALFGAMQAGAVVVPINNFLKPDEVNYILGDAGIDVVMSEASLAEAFGQLQAARPGLQVLQVAEFGRVALAPPLTEAGVREEQDLAVLIYTSGTTGHPKGAMLTHGNLLHNVESCRHVLEAVNLDRFALVLPMFHSFMLTVCILLPLSVGGSIVLIKSLHPPKRILDEIVQHGATVLPAFPQLFRMLANSPVPPQLTLRLCISGAAPLPVEILRQFNALYPIPLIEGYGLSEASPVVSVNPIHSGGKAGSIGLPVRNVEVRICSEEGRELPVGATGELCVRGGNVMRGYWNQQEETALALRDGWLYTGDIGRQDAEGFLYITDRKKDMLLVNGINVYPREIEEVIHQYPGIKETAVIGWPDARRGEQPVAYVALADGAQLNSVALLRYLKQHLADYKVPRHVIILPSLPRNATGKILKTVLRTLPRPARREVKAA